MNRKKIIVGFFLFAQIIYIPTIQGQQPDTLKVQDRFNGTVSITNNGISLIPTFSLGDPAVLFDLKYTRGRFSIEPDMRFSLEGKPWSFIFWLRYKAIQNEKFSLRLGAHPAYNFATVRFIEDGREREVIEARRFVAGEIAPSYMISENFTLGMYYLYGHGFDSTARHNHFLVLNTAFHNIKLFSEIYLNFSPQVYYLKQDDLHGTYAVAFLSLTRDDFPFSISSTLNKAIETEILPEDDFVWNISLNYRFR